MQDRKVNRSWEDKDYITCDWIDAQFEKHGTYCKFCQTNMTLYVTEDGKVESNITVDRINNALAHVQSNCQLACHTCNITKK